MNTAQIIILGIVEGLTEFLPISSTAHLIITTQLLQIPSSQLVHTFEIVIQLAAVAAVSIQYLKNILSNPKLITTIIIGFIPTAIIGFLANHFFSNALLDNSPLTAIMLLLGGLYMLTWDNAPYLNSGKKTLNELTNKDAIIIGTFQSLAIIPGVSRAASTIFAGLLRGTNPQVALEFSFLLALPTIAAASILSLSKIPLEQLPQYASPLTLGSLVAFIIAWFTIKFLQKTRVPWRYFGIYRIIISLLFIMYSLQ